MAMRLRSRDWSNAPLGQPAHWPAGLKTSLSLLLNSDRPMVCVWGRDRWVFYNDACAALSVPGHSWPVGEPLTRYEAKDWQPLATGVDQVLSTGQPLSLAVNPEGSPLMANHGWAFSAIWQTTDQVEGVFATALAPTPDPQVSKHFIDRRRPTAASLRESEARFRHLADNISQLVWMADPSGSIFWYNQRWVNFTGLPLDALQGQGWQQLHHPDHIDRVMAKIDHCFANGDLWEDTFPLRSKDGEYHWFLSRGTPVCDEQGKVLRWVGTNTDITEFRETERALKQATERLNIALKSAPITLFSQDQDLRYTWVYNPTHDYTVDQMLGQRDRDLVSAEAADRLTALKRQVLDNGVALRAEVQVDQLYYDLTIDPIRDQQGNIVGVTCAAVDISERAKLTAEHLQAEQTLRQSEEQLRMAQTAAGAGLWDWDLTDNTVIWSEEYYHLYGLDLGVTPSYENWLAAVLPADRPYIERKTREAIEQGKNLKVSFRVQHPQEGQRWLMVRGQTFYDAAGNPVRITGIAMNVTEQKRFEQALVESEARARTQAEELAALMEATPAAIWIAHDGDCRLMTANRMGHDLMLTEPGKPFSLTSAENEFLLSFKPYRQGQLMAPQDLPMQKAMRIRQEVTDEIELVYADGTVRHIYGKAVPLYDLEGIVRGAIGGFTEITAIKQSEQEREQLLQRERIAREEAEQANRLKDQFLAVLSHELRSPLNPILGWSKLLQTRRFDEAKTAQALATIERNALLQAQLVDDLLDLAKILRGKIQFTPIPVKLAGVIESALETVKGAAAAKAIALTIDLDATVQASGDAARLQQIVGNLLSNAIKFTPQAGQVTVTLHAVDSQAEITVADTGIGISAEFLPYLFESFRQEDISITRQHGGLGLGLAIVRQLVEIHGGTIAARSPGEGQGATFTVRLPKLVAKARPGPSVSLPLAAPDLRGICVFSVDDSADTRELLTVLLSQYGAEVVTIGSAAEVLDRLQHQQPDVLISDIGMPEIDGYSLIRQIRSLPPDQGGNIPAIALTAYARYEDQQESLASGYQRHLAKPLDIEKLVQTVIELTQRSRA
ncbi:PAS domain-containing protein [Nodosilinea sp. E11]|uniref:hybrid sensor histidine kinase/response regulator n=1 Tax=Nodosilinea sp. E11 TaxID=3037479 RepID=UPI0029348A13|nr:PAS domain-containing protein [Nodosilinea sp. E11]WOD40227.1 PAS domain-containing protein [Nodosilinea sp. E11]